jgi:hypothetical protein
MTTSAEAEIVFGRDTPAVRGCSSRDQAWSISELVRSFFMSSLLPRFNRFRRLLHRDPIALSSQGRMCQLVQ